MTKLNKKFLKNLALLSRIHCTEEEEEDLLKDLSDIVSFVEQLQEIDTEDISPCHHILEDMKNVMRDDEVKDLMPRDVFLENTPDKIGGFVKVPPVIKKDH